MVSKIELNKEGIAILEEHLFPFITKGNCVLFLGAGASVTDKNKYLGKELIDFYSDHLRTNSDTDDLVEFVDFIETLDKFDRPDFDNYVTELLKKLKPGKGHEAIVSHDWKEIITTNLDLILEHAHHSIEGTTKENKKLKTIRSFQEYSGYTPSDEVRYVKLNGCISDKSKYKYVFSSNDFEGANKFYNTVVKNLNSYSDQIKFLSIGYSYTDGLAKKLLKTIEKQNLATGKWVFNIDPFVTEERIKFYKSKNICSIKCGMSEFFDVFKKWEDEKGQEILKRKKIHFYNSKLSHIIVDSVVGLRLAGKIEQLNQYTRHDNISQLEFFKGTNPDFGVIFKNFDVIHESIIQKIKTHLIELEKKKDNMLPFIFITGTFGIGKTTAAYRVIFNILETEPNAVAFDILEPEHIKIEDLFLLIEKSGAQTVILHCPNIEKYNSYKDFMNFRNKVSTFQPDAKIQFLSSIRDNVLTFFKQNYEYKNIYEIPIEDKLNDDEATDLLKKLGNCGAIKVGDAQDFNKKKKEILNTYDGNTFLSLSEMVEGNYFGDYYKSALREINSEAKYAIIYTSLVYKYKLPLPASVLMRLVTKDWDDFLTSVLNVDCKGILLNYINDYSGPTEPDMLFKTRHSVLSSNVVRLEFKKDDDRLFKAYNKILTNFPPGDYYSKLAIDLLKALRGSNDLSDEKINKLFDNCAPIFETNSHFTLYYAVNLQKRNTIASYKKALEKLIYVSSFYEKRDHRIIHRRGVINFLLAIKYKDSDVDLCFDYIEEARELFTIKLMSDRFTTYSYSDYIRLELWVLQNVELTTEEILTQHITIQDLFDRANRAVFENQIRIKTLETEYINITNGDDLTNYKSLDEYIDELYKTNEYRYYALILKFNRALKTESNVDEIVHELEEFSHFSIVAKTLFRYYGRNLCNVKYRLKFLDLVKDMPELKTQDALSYSFYSYILESYNTNFAFSWEHLKYIQENYQYYNPYIVEPWIDSSTMQAQDFTINITIRKNKIVGSVKEFNQAFNICKRTSKFNFSKGEKYKGNLLFYLKGIKVTLLEKINE